MEKVVVSRRWVGKEITAFVDSEEIGSRIDLNDYLDALAEEIGRPTYLLTKEQLRTRIKEANVAIMTELKKATTYV